MARNTDIETGTGPDQGLIQLTLLSPSEQENERPVTAMLTSRGKDHDMTADQLEKLGYVCLRYAKLMRERY